MRLVVRELRSDRVFLVVRLVICFPFGMFGSLELGFPALSSPVNLIVCNHVYWQLIVEKNWTIASYM